MYFLIKTEHNQIRPFHRRNTAYFCIFCNNYRLVLTIEQLNSHKMERMLSWFKPKADLSLKRMKYNVFLQYLSDRELHKEIIRLRDVPGVEADSELTEVLRELAEIMIHGEKQSDAYFEYVCFVGLRIII